MDDIEYAWLNESDVGHPMDDIEYAWLTEADIVRLAEIDRTEIVRTGYVVKDGTLGKVPVEWDIPAFRTEGGGEHTVAAQISFCRQHIRAGGKIVGAFVDGRLAGLGVVTPDVRPRMAQLAYLHVGLAYRRRGIASRLTRESALAGR